MVLQEDTKKVKMVDQNTETRVDVEDKECSTNTNVVIKQVVEMVHQFAEALEPKIQMIDQMTQSNTNIKDQVNDQLKEEKVCLKQDFKGLEDSDKLLLGQIESLIDKKFSELQLRVFKKIDELASSNSDKIEEKKIDQYNDIKYEEENYEKIPMNMQCSLCKKNIIGVKFTCLVCYNLNLCVQCESTHNHTTAKIKGVHEANAKGEIYNLLKKFEKEDFPEHNIGILTGLRNSFSGCNKYSAKLKVEFANEVRARPSKSFKIPLLVANTCKNQIPSNTLILVRGIRDLKVRSLTIGIDIDPKASIPIEISGEAAVNAGVYDLEILLYHNQVEIECEILKIMLVVNDDKEEEELDIFFEKHPKLLLIPKLKKQILRKIKLEGYSDKDLTVIYNIMEKYRWSIDYAIEELVAEY